MRRKAIASTLGFVLVIAAPGAGLAGSSSGVDNDGDGIDDTFDNCRDVSNTSQIDVDGDGCGNHCDADFDQNAVSGSSDVNVFRACFTKSVGAGAGPANDPTCAESDMDGNNIVGSSDFNLFRFEFTTAPGPSLNPLRNPAVCP